MKKERLGKLLFIVGLIIAFVPVFLFPILGLFYKEFASNLMFLDYRIWLFFIVGILIAAYGSYIRNRE